MAKILIGIIAVPFLFVIFLDIFYTFQSGDYSSRSWQINNDAWSDFLRAFPLGPWIGFAFIFIPIWITTSYLVAWRSGWKKLAEHYRATNTPSGKTFYFESCVVNKSAYKKGMTIIVSEQGLFMKVLPIFRFGHAPLFIPWANINTIEKKPLSGWAAFNLWYARNSFFECALILPADFKIRLPERIVKAFPSNPS